MKTTVHLFFACLVCLQGTVAFVPPASHKEASSVAPLWGKVKRGKLGREVDASSAPVRPNKKAKSNKAAKSDVNISPALVEWMATQQEGKAVATAPDTPTPVATSSSSSSASTYTSFDDDEKTSRKKKNKPVKPSARKAAEDARDQRLKGLVKELQDALESKAAIDVVLNTIRQVLELPPANFKQLSASAARQDFRLAWVGSDDAVCHVGTGLHKVPLARLQEVFLSFCGRNRVEVLEVIRVLGPFPNVKNTLQGQSSFTRDQESDIVQWRLMWDSMLDGTGKEISAGKDENVQRVDLQVYFSSPAIVVAVVPPDAENYAVKRSDPLEDQGQHVLVFVREDNLDEQLDALRV